MLNIMVELITPGLTDRPPGTADPAEQPAPPQPGSVSVLEPAAGGAGETAPPDPAAAQTEQTAAAPGEQVRDGETCRTRGAVIVDLNNLWGDTNH